MFFTSRVTVRCQRTFGRQRNSELYVGNRVRTPFIPLPLLLFLQRSLIRRNSPPPPIKIRKFPPFPHAQQLPRLISFFPSFPPSLSVPGQTKHFSSFSLPPPLAPLRTSHDGYWHYAAYASASASAFLLFPIFIVTSFLSWGNRGEWAGRMDYRCYPPPPPLSAGGPRVRRRRRDAAAAAAASASPYIECKKRGEGRNREYSGNMLACHLTTFVTLKNNFHLGNK